MEFERLLWMLVSESDDTGKSQYTYELDWSLITGHVTSNNSLLIEQHKYIDTRK